MFPSQRALDEGGLASLEEERRLAYVAITRARRKCFILHAANRRIYGQWTSSIPSRFVAELPDDACRAGNDDDRRRHPVARQLVRARRSVRRRRARGHRADPRPRLAARRSSGGFDRDAAARDRGRRAAPSASAIPAAPTSRSASASSTTSSATARSPRSKATSSRSTSSMPAASGCSTASSA